MNPAWPDEHTLIPDLLSAAPQTRVVLDRYGLHGCGGPHGPVETLGFFARAHDVAVARLLSEIRRVCDSPPSVRELPIVNNPQPDPADAIYRPFFKSGIVIALTLGAVWGAWLLLRIAMTGRFTAASLHDVNAHGHAQIFGWVGLFVMGFAYQAFPRLKHTVLAWPRLAFATLWMMLLGLVLRSVLQPIASEQPWAFWPAIGASLLEVAAIGLFAAILLKTWGKAKLGQAPYDGYVLSALFWFVLQAVSESAYLAATLSVEGEQLVALVGTWQPALRDIQIHGFALLMILGVSQRIFHHFYGLRQPNPRLSRAMLVVLNAAVAGEACGLVLMRTSGPVWAALWYASALALSAAVVALVADWRVFSRSDEADRSLKFLRAAYVWLLVSLVMLVGLPAYLAGLPLVSPESSAAAIGFSHAYYGAIRHAITVGFVSLMIVGVASKVVPTLNGVDSHRLSALWAPFLLINLGCALRVLGQTATDFTAGAFPLAGASGLLEVTGLALWGGHLWRVMSGRARLRPEREAASEPLTDIAPIGPRHTVGAVLERHPELLETFVSFGFTMLVNPQLRRTTARVVTLERACRRTGAPLPELLDRLNAERTRLRGDSSAAVGAAGGGPPKAAAFDSRNLVTLSDFRTP